VFRKKVVAVPPVPLASVQPVDGLMITDGTSCWLISGGKRRKCYSDRVRRSWSLDPILVTTAAAKVIPLAGTLGFRDGTLIKDITSGRIYLISRSRARLVANPDVLDILGRDRIIEVSKSEIDIHLEGEPINGI
jgi:hypothetical protein